MHVQGVLLFLVRFNNSAQFEIYGVTRSSSSRLFLCALDYIFKLYFRQKYTMRSKSPPAWPPPVPGSSPAGSLLPPSHPHTSPPVHSALAEVLQGQCQTLLSSAWLPPVASSAASRQLGGHRSASAGRMSHLQRQKYEKSKMSFTIPYPNSHMHNHFSEYDQEPCSFVNCDG